MAILLGSGVTCSIESVGGIWEWTIGTNNVRSMGQTYEVTNIKSPFGLLSSVNLPIPGDVVQAMADSIAELRSQYEPLVALVTGQQSTFNITVTEGDPSQFLDDVNFQNSGAYGSFLSVTASDRKSVV